MNRTGERSSAVEHVRDPGRVVVGEHDLVVVARSDAPRAIRTDGPSLGGDPFRSGLEHDHPAPLTLHLRPERPRDVGRRHDDEPRARHRAARGTPPRRPRRDGTCASRVRPRPGPRRPPRRRPRRTPRTRACRAPRRPGTIAIALPDRAGRRADHPHGLRLDPRARRRPRVGPRGAAIARRGRSGWAPVAPPRSSTACGTTGSTAASDSRTPFGLPGRFRISADSDGAGDAPGERGHRRLGEPGRPHQLREPGGLAFDHGAGRLRRHVARTEPGAAGRHDEPVRRRRAPGAPTRSPLARRGRRGDPTRRTRRRGATPPRRRRTRPRGCPAVTPSETVSTAARVVPVPRREPSAAEVSPSAPRHEGRPT